MGVNIKDIQFYEEKYDNKIYSHLVTSKLAELYMFLGILTYLIVLYIGLQVNSIIIINVVVCIEILRKWALEGNH